MMKTLNLLFVSLLLCKFSLGMVIEKNKWNYFNGKLNKKEMRLALYISDKGDVNGSYSFKEKDSKILVSGALDQETLVLTETLADKQTQSFKGAFWVDDNENTFYKASFFDKAKNTNDSISLKLVDVCVGTSQNMYSRINPNDAEVEQFVQELSTQLVANNKNWIKNHVYYPLLWGDGKGTFTNIRVEQMDDYFSRIFNEKLKYKIKISYHVNLRQDFTSIIIGDEYVYISCIKDAKTNKRKFIITGVNDNELRSYDN